jgi:peptide/nickel transport system permease protein
MQKFLQSKSVLLGIGILMFVTLIALFAPLLFEHSPWMILGEPLLKPFESAQYCLGTDILARDIATGLAYGARASLLIGFIATLVAVSIGIVIGALAGFYGRWVDHVLMGITELFQTIPSFALAVVFIAVFKPQFYSVVGAIALVSWPPVARLVRGEFLSLKTRDFVKAAIVVGQSEKAIIFKQILPNVLPSIIVAASLMIATAILTESALAFLGLGDRNLMSWGFMLGASRSLLREAPWMSLMPGSAILLTVLAINLVGEGLNTCLNSQKH